MKLGRPMKNTEGYVDGNIRVRDFLFRAAAHCVSGVTREEYIAASAHAAVVLIETAMTVNSGLWFNPELLVKGEEMSSDKLATLTPS